MDLTGHSRPHITMVKLGLISSLDQLLPSRMTYKEFWQKLRLLRVDLILVHRFLHQMLEAQLQSIKTTRHSQER